MLLKFISADVFQRILRSFTALVYPWLWELIRQGLLALLLRLLSLKEFIYRCLQLPAKIGDEHSVLVELVISHQILLHGELRVISLEIGIVKQIGWL